MNCPRRTAWLGRQKRARLCPSCALVQGLGLGEEDVGLIGITVPGGLLNGQGGDAAAVAAGGGEQDFVEIVPWNGELEWEVQPWGSWCVLCVRAWGGKARER